MAPSKLSQSESQSQSQSESPVLHAFLIQGDTRWENPAANREYYGEQLKMALWPDEGPRLTVLPETFSSGFSMRGKEVAEPPDGESMRWMGMMAAQHESWLMGSLYIQEPSSESVFNRAVLVSPSGGIHTYDKAHLFPLSREHEVYSPGDAPCPILDIDSWALKISVCYDLRFPVWLRGSPAEPYDVLAVVANWPQVRAEHWRTLLRARAIENQAYVIGVNRVGRDGNGYSYGGDSMVIDPWGEIVRELGSNENTAMVTIDRARVEEARQAIPSLAGADRFKLLGR